jgi:hypothetical protein
LCRWFWQFMFLVYAQYNRRYEFLTCRHLFGSNRPRD